MTSMVSWLLGVPQANGGLNPLDDRYYELPGQGGMSRAGVRVSADSAMKASAVYRCVSILANVLAMFPKSIYEHLERGRQAAPDHPLDPIISFRPNRRQNAFVFWRQVCYHLILRQNAYVQIIPGPSGRGWVGQLIPLHPDRINGPEELADGRLRYEYRPPNGGQPIKMMGDLDIWHLTGLSSDGLRGLSMLDVANDSIGLSLAAERHASRFFERGVKPSGILQHEKTLKPETAREMSESFGRVYGGEEGTGRVPVLWEGMKFNPISMTLKDAEFLDSRKFSVSEIARWFGVPPHMVGDVERSTSWGTGIEQQGLHFLVYSLQPWIELLEQSIRFTLVVQPERYYPKFNVNAILRMDAKTQADVFSVLIDKGVLNPNECRELLERNPREDGDNYVDVSTSIPSIEREAADIAGILVRAGYDPIDAAKVAGLPKIEHSGLLPVTVQPPSRAPVGGATASPTPAPDDAPPDDTAEPDDTEPKDEPAAARAVAAARAIARARAEELLDEEREGLMRLAKENARRSEVWPIAAARFYGYFAGRVAAAMACSKGAAKQWCETRRGLVLSEGIGGLTDGRQSEASTALVALALSGG